MLCLARALLRRSRIVVMDEATASIDRATEKKLQEMIQREFVDATVLTIAHRLATVLESDRIMVLSDGKVAEFDTPKRLAQIEGGVFRQLAEEGGSDIKFCWTAAWQRFRAASSSTDHIMATFATAEHARLSSLMRNWETHNALRHHPTQVSVPPRLLVMRCLDRGGRETCAAFKVCWIESGSDARVLAEWLHLVQLAARAGPAVFQLLYAPYACWHAQADCAFCERNERRVSVELLCARITGRRSSSKITHWNSASVLHAVLTHWQGEDDPSASASFKQVCAAIRALVGAARLAPAVPIELDVVVDLRSREATLPHGDIISLRNIVSSNQQELLELSAFTVVVGEASIPRAHIDDMASIPRAHIDDMVSDMLLGETPLRFKALGSQRSEWNWLLESTKMRDMVEHGWLQLSLCELHLTSRRADTKLLAQICEALLPFSSLKSLCLDWTIAASAGAEDNGLEDLNRLLFSEESKVRLDELTLRLQEDGWVDDDSMGSPHASPRNRPKERLPLRHKKIELWTGAASCAVVTPLLENAARYPPETLCVVGTTPIHSAKLRDILLTHTFLQRLTLSSIKCDAGDLLELALLSSGVEQLGVGRRSAPMQWRHLRALSLHFQTTTADEEATSKTIDVLLRVLGSRLTELTLSNDGEGFSARTAGVIQDRCPKLQTLSVSGFSRHFLSTLDAGYTIMTAHIRYLTLGLTTTGSKIAVLELFRLLLNDSNRITRVLRELRITEEVLNARYARKKRIFPTNESDSSKRKFTQAAFSVLAANPRIRLVLDPHDPLRGWPGAPVRHRFAMQAELPLLSSRLALLSVLSRKELDVPRDVLEIVWAFLVKRVPRLW
ncbi:hypothetical protein ATCC90586_008025 [Pythium insidiosum]|nr:hypothetical protein ATCC90586_008025 [Pythium insidiosum]